ncbi:MAG: hypothetical protein BWX66_00753 [Deltaproteobacteria bacterium ADurb.Bin058]|nr:MAG: hypothetical protein BWX66_00753 [Deltaproteobacteria bacterium ADurb.Bin058]
MRVLLQGVGRYGRDGKLQKMENIKDLKVLKMNDVAARLEDLKALRDGWLDGDKGFAPDKKGLDWLAEAFQRGYPDELPLPYLYPTAEGGVQAEWSLNGWEISLEIDLERKHGEWHALEMTTETEEEKSLKLDEPDDWQWLAREIARRMRGET